MANQLVSFKNDVDRLIFTGIGKEQAIIMTIKKLISECRAIHFEGNGYSDEWKEEAKKRGLDCETSVPVIYDAYLKPKHIEVFEKMAVLSQKELESRCEVKWEIYTKKIQIESRVMGDLTMNHILPVASQYQGILLDKVAKMKMLFSEDEFSVLSAQDMGIIRTISEHINFITSKTNEMVEMRKIANKIENEREKAIAYHDTVLPLMEEIRYHIDKLELIVDDKLWTLPKYRELLFIK